jgi:hypothetical protein
MSKRLDHLLHQNAIWSKAINPFQLTFSPYDPKNICSTITSLGVLAQNGKKKLNNNNNNTKIIFTQGKFFIKNSNFASISHSESSNGNEQRKTTQSKLENDPKSTILLDRSDDYCAVCRCGGELVCCDECPRVYHIECHVPSLNEISMNDKWKCGLCSEVNSSLKRKIDDNNEKLSSTEKQICDKLVLQMFTHPSSVPFHHPVPADVS